MMIFSGLTGQTGRRGTLIGRHHERSGVTGRGHIRVNDGRIREVSVNHPGRDPEVPVTGDGLFHSHSFKTCFKTWS